MATYKLVPQNLIPECILYYNYAEISSPIGGIHLNYHIFILGYYTFVTH